MKITKLSIKDDLFSDIIRFQTGELTIYELMDKILACKKLEEWFYQQRMSRDIHDVEKYYKDEKPSKCPRCGSDSIMHVQNH